MAAVRWRCYKISDRRQRRSSKAAGLRVVSRLAAVETQLRSHLRQSKMTQDRSESPSVLAAMVSSPAGPLAIVAGRGARSAACNFVRASAVLRLLPVNCESTRSLKYAAAEGPNFSAARTWVGLFYSSAGPSHAHAALKIGLPTPDARWPNAKSRCCV